MIINNKINYPEYPFVIREIKKTKSEEYLNQKIKDLIPFIKENESNDVIYKKISKLCHIALQKHKLKSPYNCEIQLQKILSQLTPAPETLIVTNVMTSEIASLDVKNLIQELLSLKIKELEEKSNAYEKEISNLEKEIDRTIVSTEVNKKNLEIEIKQMNLKTEKLKITNHLDDLKDINLNNIKNSEKKILRTFLQEQFQGKLSIGQVESIISTGCLKNPKKEEVDCFINSTLLNKLTIEQKYLALQAGILKKCQVKETREFLEISLRTFFFQQLFHLTKPQKGCFDFLTKSYEGTCKKFIDFLKKEEVNEIPKNIDKIVRLSNVPEPIYSEFMHFIAPKKQSSLYPSSEEIKKVYALHHPLKEEVKEQTLSLYPNIEKIQNEYAQFEKAEALKPLPTVDGYCVDSFDVPSHSYIDLMVSKFCPNYQTISPEQVWASLPKSIQKDALRHVHLGKSGVIENIVRKLGIHSLPQLHQNSSHPLVQEGEELATFHYECYGSNKKLLEFYRRFRAWGEKVSQDPSLRIKFFKAVLEMSQLNKIQNPSQDPKFAENNWWQIGMTAASFSALEKLLHATGLIVVEYPCANENEKLFIRGDGLEMHWDHGTELEPLGNDRFVYNADPSNGPFHFKILRNDRDWQSNIPLDSNLKYEEDALTVKASF